MLRMFAGLLIVVGALATVAENVAHVTSVQNSTLEFMNTGRKAITGVVIRRLNPAPVDVIWADFYESPLEPSQTMKLHGWSDRGLTVEIAAVIFKDGTTLGGAVDRGNGQELVSEIFARRKGEAAEWARWKEQLQSNGLEKFVQAAGTVQIPEGPQDMEASGHVAVLHAVHALAMSAINGKAHGDQSAFDKIAPTLEYQHAMAASSALRRDQ